VVNRTNATQRADGYTLIEVVCAFAVLSVLAITIYLGEAGQLRTVGRSFQDTAAAHLVAGRLEEVMADDTVPPVGETVFEIEQNERLHSARGVQVVREVQPGLFEVTAEVRWIERDKPREYAMSTMIARAAAKRRRR